MRAQTDHYLKTISQIWADGYPPAAPRRRLLIEKLLTTAVVFLRLLSLDNIKVLFDESTGHSFMDLYVLAFAVLLTMLLFAPIRLGLVGAAIGFYRVLDIVTYRLYFLLVKSEARPWSAAKLRRSLLIGVVNFYESVVAYAVLYSTIGHVVPTNTLMQTQFTAKTALYYSTVTAVTLGYGDYVPADDFSRMLVVSQLFCTMLFLIFVIPALVSLFSALSVSGPS